MNLPIERHKAIIITNRLGHGVMQADAQPMCKNKDVKELEQLIESMKCCYNCGRDTWCSTCDNCTRNYDAPKMKRKGRSLSDLWIKE